MHDLAHRILKVCKCCTWSRMKSAMLSTTVPCSILLRDYVNLVHVTCFFWHSPCGLLLTVVVTPCLSDALNTTCVHARLRSSLVKTLPITKKNKHTVVTEAPQKSTCAAFALANLLQKADSGSNWRLSSGLRWSSTISTLRVKTTHELAQRTRQLISCELCHALNSSLAMCESSWCHVLLNAPSHALL